MARSMPSLGVRFEADLSALDPGFQGYYRRLDQGVGRTQVFANQIQASLGRVSQLRPLEAIFLGMDVRMVAKGMAMVSAPLVAATAVSFKFATDFEGNMRDVNSIAHLSARSFEELSDRTLELSRRISVVKAPAELAKGLYDVYSSGFKSQQALTILRQSAEGAVAGLTDVSTAAQVTVGAMNAFAEQGLTAQKAMDVMFKTVDLGILRFPDLAQGLGQVMAPAARAGITFEEIGAALATMTRAGLPPAEAMVSLARSITNIISPTEEAKKTAAALGLQWNIAGLRAHGLIGVLDEMVAKTKGNTTQITALVGEERAMRGVFSLLRQGGSEYRAMLDEITLSAAKGGATAAAQAEQMESLRIKLESLGKSASILATSIGESWLPALKAIVDGANSIVRAIDETDTGLAGFGKAILTSVGPPIAVVAAATAAFLFVGSQALTVIGTWKNANLLLGQSHTALTAHTQGLTNALARNAAATTATAAAGAGLVRSQAQQLASTAALGAAQGRLTATRQLDTNALVTQAFKAKTSQIIQQQGLEALQRDMQAQISLAGRIASETAGLAMIQTAKFGPRFKSLETGKFVGKPPVFSEIERIAGPSGAAAALKWGKAFTEAQATTARIVQGMTAGDIARREALERASLVRMTNQARMGKQQTANASVLIAAAEAQRIETVRREFTLRTGLQRPVGAVGLGGLAETRAEAAAQMATQKAFRESALGLGKLSDAQRAALDGVTEMDAKLMRQVGTVTAAGNGFVLLGDKVRGAAKGFDLLGKSLSAILWGTLIITGLEIARSFGEWAVNAKVASQSTEGLGQSFVRLVDARRKAEKESRDFFRFLGITEPPDWLVKPWDIELPLLGKSGQAQEFAKTREALFKLTPETEHAIANAAALRKEKLEEFRAQVPGAIRDLEALRSKALQLDKTPVAERAASGIERLGKEGAEALMVPILTQVSGAERKLIQEHIDAINAGLRSGIPGVVRQAEEMARDLQKKIGDLDVKVRLTFSVIAKEGVTSIQDVAGSLTKQLKDLSQGAPLSIQVRTDEALSGIKDIEETLRLLDREAQIRLRPQVVELKGALSSRDLDRARDALANLQGQLAKETPRTRMMILPDLSSISTALKEAEKFTGDHPITIPGVVEVSLRQLQGEIDFTRAEMAREGVQIPVRFEDALKSAEAQITGTLDALARGGQSNIPVDVELLPGAIERIVDELRSAAEHEGIKIPVSIEALRGLSIAEAEKDITRAQKELSDATKALEKELAGYVSALRTVNIGQEQTRLEIMQAQMAMAPYERAVKAAERALNAIKREQDAVRDSLEKARDAFDIAKERVSEFEKQIDKAKQTLSDFSSPSLTGMRELERQMMDTTVEAARLQQELLRVGGGFIPQIDAASKAILGLQLALLGIGQGFDPEINALDKEILKLQLQMEEAGETAKDMGIKFDFAEAMRRELREGTPIIKQFLDLQRDAEKKSKKDDRTDNQKRLDELERQRRIADLRRQVAEFDTQKQLEAAQKNQQILELRKQIAEFDLQKQLEAIQHQRELLDLRKTIEFEPLLFALKQLADAFLHPEVSFEEARNQIERAILDLEGLGPALEEANRVLAEREAVIKRLEAIEREIRDRVREQEEARDRATAALEPYKQKIEGLEEISAQLALRAQELSINQAIANDKLERTKEQYAAIAASLQEFIDTMNAFADEPPQTRGLRESEKIAEVMRKDAEEVAEIEKSLARQYQSAHASLVDFSTLLKETFPIATRISVEAPEDVQVKVKFNTDLASLHMAVAPVQASVDALFDPFKRGNPWAGTPASRALGGFATGGTVPGPPGMPQLAVVHGGERYLGNTAPSNVTNWSVNITNNHPQGDVVALLHRQATLYRLTRGRR